MNLQHYNTLKKCVIIFTFFLNMLHAKQDLNIVTTFTVLQDLVRQITFGIPGIKIFNIVSNDLDPHIYQPVPNDSKMLAQADLVFVNGLGFEGWIERLIASSGYKGEVINAAQTVKPRFLLYDEKSCDPHAWHDVQNAIKYVEVISSALQKKDPLNSSLYQKNTASLIKELRELHQWVIDLFIKIPNSQKIVLTTHDAFWYFGGKYGIKFISPLGISTDAEPAAKDVAEIITSIKSKKIKAIFIENLANPRLIQQIVKETNTKIYGTLYADSLSESAKTYQDMIKHNTLMIFKAICQKKEYTND